MWELMSSYLGTDRGAIQRQIVNHVEYTLARTRFNFDNFGAYQAASFAVRDRLLESWNDTQQYHEANDCKRVYYLSLEFLMGRTF
jgi:starch phosphorylase